MPDKPADTHPLNSAHIHWDEHGQPTSSHFNDIYFSTDDGLAETNHTFINGNQLPARFSALAKNAQFIIGETGFGSGLNFIATWQCWLNTAPTTAHLHFISVERYPLSWVDLKKALALWPTLAPLSDALITAYPGANITGLHSIKLGKVTLTLIIDTAESGFKQLLASEHPSYDKPHWQGVNAWFLDGFAPAKNPDMWTQPLINTIAKLSHPKASVATFTAAGSVKRHLQASGFSVTKRRGFGRKRDMITAKLQQPYTPPTPAALQQLGHRSPFPLAWNVPSHQLPCSNEQSVVVIGAGLAGAHTARALAEKGLAVTVIERAATPATGASGNAQGIVYAKLSQHREDLGEFNLFSLLKAQQTYQPLWSTQYASTYGSRCGVLQLSTAATTSLQHQRIVERFDTPQLLHAVSAQQASEIAGVPIALPGIFFPNSGWLKPVQVCRYLLNHPLITLQANTHVQHISKDNHRWRIDATQYEQPWQLHGISHLVIATANDAKQLLPTQWLPTNAIRGQVTHVPESKNSQALKSVICSKGYIAPAQAGYHCIGASFNLHNHSPELTAADHLNNLQHITEQSPGLLTSNATSLLGRVSFRCTTPDYLPMAGPAPDREAFIDTFAALRKNARAIIHQPGRYHEGLYLNIGHGSRGLAYTPLCAELLTSYITGSPPPLPEKIISALNPSRFIIRDLIRGRC